MMPGLGWQDVAAGVATLMALAWLVRRRLRRRSGSGGACGACPGCAAAAGDEAGPGTTPARAGWVPLSDFSGRRR